MAISKVTSGGIADGTLSVEDIKDDAVTAAKLANSINTDIATGVTGNTTANAALPKAGGAMTGAITTNSTFDGVDIATRDGVLTSTTATAAAALPKAGGTMTGTTVHGDNVKDTYGTGNDLEIFHDGSNSRIKDVGTGVLAISGSELHFNNAASDENMIVAIQDSSVKLYHNNAKKIETSASGVSVIGNVDIVGAGKVGVEGGDSLYIQSGTTSGSGLHFHPSNGLTPLRNGARIDNTIDLGTASARFKDLYLSGGLKVGGTGTANTLDDYEEGTFTVGVDTGTISATTGSYTKIGNLVSVDIIAGDFNDITTNAIININGLPFASNRNSHGVVMFQYTGEGANGLTAYMGTNTTKIMVFHNTPTSNWEQITHSDLTNTGAYLRISMVYATNS